jgi:adenine-specific DNA glycosylase
MECNARLNGTVNKLPVKKPKTTLLNRYFYYFHIRLPNDRGYDMYLSKRTEGDIWKNLYDFVLTELPQKTEVNDDFIINSLKKRFDLKDVVINGISKEYKQRLSHQLIHAVFIKIIVHKKVKLAHENSLILVPEKHLIDYPVPRLIERYVTDEKIIK